MELVLLFVKTEFKHTMENKKIFITGGAGFIGSHLVKNFLQKNWKVSVLDNCSAGNKLCARTMQEIQFYKGDVRNLAMVYEAAKNCDAIVHLAAVVGVDEVINRKIETIEVETIGTQNIVKAAKLFGVKKIIYSSSSAVYKNTKNESCQEEDNLDLVNAYAVAKRLNELYLDALTLEEGISTNSLRFFNVYGSNQDNRMVVPRFFEQAMQNKPIQVFGNGRQTRDFTHIDNVVKAIQNLIDAPRVNGIFNISRGIETTILDLAKMIKQISNSNSQIELLDFPKKRKAYKVNRRVGSANKLKNHVGEKPEIILNEGLERLYNHLSDQIPSAARQ